MSDATRLFAIVGPSGAGKDTLIAGAMAALPDLRLVRRVITRPSDAGGEDFDGVTPEVFAQRKAAGEFALDWVAHGLCYGLPAAALRAPGTVLFNGSRAALPEALARFPDLVVILVTAPDAVLAARLAARGRETQADIGQRLARATFALPHGITPRVVVNDGPQAQGVARLVAALQPDRG
ncbi:MAG: phosphonate metabolism protein/1,5-bisphosphokinase (PRPP-forming) PhnN [Rhodobacteraceae bacterium]|nr:phosphonate metabolism protein/1,5-bisphosphokinase (PRPP-forming) PhnN [Paracoccaceae bacterium]MCF8514293.1 phosphonate metabolism protein/1,5-bisphosphokinase (PRPP-forming) PhnN [Paracoccaceae bacterium]MCF8518537.1 phosphonate metabolism protein/1,5-bisphosphokinase (PRPP-forming) PhnN [Paracoccaceae bacterium]